MSLSDSAILGTAATQSLTGTADQNSTNVYDAGSAVKKFAGTGSLKIEVRLTAVGGTSPTFRARFVGADDSALTSNVEILDDTGTTKVLSASDIPAAWMLKPTNQKAAKRYYGLIYTQGGTNPTASVDANAVLTGQSNMIP